MKFPDWLKTQTDLMLDDPAYVITAAICALLIVFIIGFGIGQDDQRDYYNAQINECLAMPDTLETFFTAKTENGKITLLDNVFPPCYRKAISCEVVEVESSGINPSKIFTTYKITMVK